MREASVDGRTAAMTGMEHEAPCFLIFIFAAACCCLLLHLRLAAAVVFDSMPCVGRVDAFFVYLTIGQIGFVMAQWAEAGVPDSS